MFLCFLNQLFSNRPAYAFGIEPSKVLLSGATIIVTDLETSMSYCNSEKEDVNLNGGDVNE